MSHQCFSYYIEGTVSALQQKSAEISDERELEEYKENMAWKDEATKGFHAWWEGMQSSVTNPEKKRVSLSQ